MRRRNVMRGLAVLLSVATLSGGICSNTVFAGSNDTVVDNSSFSEEINTDIWNSPEGDVTVENGKLIFPADGTEETRLITTAATQENKRLSELFRASVTMKLTELPEGEKFAFAFGLQSVEAYQGNKGNVEVSFSNQGGLKVEVTAYGDGGEATKVVEPTACSSMNSNIAIEVTLKTGGKLTLNVAGKTLCSDMQLPVSGQGRLGFVQTGGCGAEVSKVNFAIHRYDAPQNCNVEENFDNGFMNTGAFTSKTVWGSDWYPQSLSVQEYKGNNVLMFERTALAYIGTRYTYSNFEMTFDVPYMQRKEVRDENGVLVEPSTTNMLISFGGATMDHSAYGYTEATDCIVFHANSYVSNYRETYSGRDENHMIFSSDNEKDKGFSVRLSVIDTVVTVELKWLEETTYSKVLEYTLQNGTPTGYIHLWTNVIGNFAVDNIKIINKDVEPELIDVEATHDNFDRVADFKYEESEMVFRDETTPDAKEEETIPAEVYKLVLYPTLVGVVLLAGGFAIGEGLRRKRKKQIGGGQNEA